MYSVWTFVLLFPSYHLWSLLYHCVEVTMNNSRSISTPSWSVPAWHAWPSCCWPVSAGQCSYFMFTVLKNNNNKKIVNWWFEICYAFFYDISYKLHLCGQENRFDDTAVFNICEVQSISPNYIGFDSVIKVFQLMKKFIAMSWHPKAFLNHEGKKYQQS